MNALAKQSVKPQPTRRYRMDFVLILITGNETRYLNTRPLVEQDHALRLRWYPVRTWVEGDWLRFLSGGLRVRARHLLDTWRLYVRRPAEVMIIHAFETYTLYSLLHRFLRLKTAIIWNGDRLEHTLTPGLQGRLRANAIRQTTCFVPFSTWAGRQIQDAYPEVSSERIVVLHPGLRLDKWPQRAPCQPGARFRLLFVGGMARRKGLDALLDAFEGHLSASCEAHVVTEAIHLSDDLRARLSSLEHVFLYTDLRPGSAGLQGLYQTSDAFVLPTTYDASSWVSLEAMATGIPVITTAIGGIPDIVIDGETGLIVPQQDPDAIVQAVERLRRDPTLRERLIAQARAHVEAHFDAATNTKALLALAKSLVDAGAARSRA